MICVSLGNLNSSEVNKAIVNFDFVEIRFDLLRTNDDEFSQYIQRSDKLIATGRVGINPNKEVIKYIEKSIESNVKYVDIDYKERGYYIRALKLLQSSTTKLILSYHNYEETPEIDELKTIISDMKLLNPDIIKICLKANEINDIIRTMFLYHIYPETSLVAFNLGIMGSLSRLLALKAGAPFMYAALDNDHRVEKSQLTYQELKSLMNIINNE
jgi:3-dehydroquinate dehydratase I